MKSNRKYILPFLALGLTMASCSDFLDKEPLDQGTDAIMFKSPEQFDQAALALYSFPDWKSANYDGGLDVSRLYLDQEVPCQGNPSMMPL